jgi:AraC-like DNA-binding protein
MATPLGAKAPDALSDMLDSLAYGAVDGLAGAISASGMFGGWPLYAIALFSAGIPQEIRVSSAFAAMPFHRGRACLFAHGYDFDVRAAVEEMIAPSAGALDAAGEASSAVAAHVGDGPLAPPPAAATKAGVSGDGAPNSIQRLYGEAAAMLGASLFFPGRSVTHMADELEKERAAGAGALPEKERAALEASMRRMDHSAFCDALERLFADNLGNKSSFDAVGRRYGHVASILAGSAGSLGLPAAQLPNRLSAFADPAQLRLALSEAFQAMRNAFLEKLGHSTLETAAQYIRDNLENVDMAQIANYANFNYSYFSELFKKTFGVNFSQYTQRLKMERAMALLRGGEKVSGVTALLGYTNAKNFTRAFKKHFGVSPANWMALTGKGPPAR